MSKHIEEIMDDEVQIIGHAHKTVPPVEEKSRRNKGVAFVSAIIVIAIGILAIIFWPKAEPEDPFDGVFENATLNETPVVNGTPTVFGHVADSSKAYAERVDTVINDIPLAIYIPHNAVPQLSVGRPDPNDKSIILIAQAADIRGDNKKILGAFVLKGEPLAWGLSKKGFCAIIDGQMTVGTSPNSPLFEEATEKGGYFFRQFSLVDKGVLVENELKNKSVRKALCQRLEQNFIAVSQTSESFHDFAQALVDLGVENAISLVGSQYAYGWFIDEKGEQEMFGEDVHKYKNENYILWRP